MIIWILQAYDQPNGQSDRSAVFAKYFANLGQKVTLFTNAYCNFRKHTVKEFRTNHSSDYIDDGYDVVWLRSLEYKNSVTRFLNMIENMLRILIAAKSILDRPDVIIVPSVPPTTALAGFILSRKYKCKVVYEVRDVWPAALIDSGVLSRRGIISLIFRFIEKYAYKKSALVVSTLDNVRGHVLNVNTEQKIVVIPNPFDFDKLTRMSSTSEVDIPKDRKKKHTAVYIGGFGIDHDVLAIVRAARRLMSKKNIEFKLYGDGLKREECEEYCNKHGVSNVRFMGIVEKSKLLQVQQDADVLLAAITDSVTYKYGVNLNKIVSYLASGKPIIFSGNELPPAFKVAFVGYHSSCNDIDAFAKNILKGIELDRKTLCAIKENATKALNTQYEAKALAEYYLSNLNLLKEDV